MRSVKKVYGRCFICLEEVEIMYVWEEGEIIWGEGCIAILFEQSDFFQVF